jgi:excisionase family DNA binding protein
MGIGNVLAGSLQNMQNQPNQTQPAQVQGAAAMPDVMTPAEVANIVKVSEEDIMAAIVAGDLKARKIGSAYRISKDALVDFLKG